MTCVWTPDPACLGSSWADADESDKDRALLLATSSLQMLTYYRVGSCPITIRPVTPARPCACAWNPHMDADGLWRNNCNHYHEYGYTGLNEVDIPGPVGFIDNMTIDGETIDLWNGDWRLDDGHVLVYQGAGPNPLPLYNDLTKPNGAVGTWTITYSKSYPVLADGRIAVAYLAAEFLKACIPKAKCALPRGVTSVVRNGVSFQVEAGLFPNGLTGIDIVDQYILKWAPAGSPTRTASVFTPGRPKARVTNLVPARASDSPGFDGGGFGL